jgi:hypothetical protein
LRARKSAKYSVGKDEEFSLESFDIDGGGSYEDEGEEERGDYEVEEGGEDENRVNNTAS